MRYHFSSEYDPTIIYFLLKNQAFRHGRIKQNVENGIIRENHWGYPTAICISYEISEDPQTQNSPFPTIDGIPG